jgi:hypothetical protein
MAFKTPLEAAIAHLIAQGKIKSSADVARDLHLKSRGTVSSYVTGSTKISSNFQTMFENTYNIRLKDFEGKAGKEINNPDPMSQDYREKFYQLLDKNSKLEEKIDKIESNLNRIPGSMEKLTELILEGQQSRISELYVLLSKDLSVLTEKIAAISSSGSHKKPIRKEKH